MSDLEYWKALSLDAVRRTPAPVPAGPADLNEQARRVAQGLRRPALRPRTLAALAAALEATALFAAFWIAGLVAIAPPPAPAGAAALAACGALASVVALAALGAYDLRALRRSGRSLAVAFGVSGGLGVLGATIAGLDGASAFAPVGAAVAAAVAPLRLLFAAVADWALEAGLTDRRAVIVGGGINAKKLVEGLSARPDNDIRLCAIFDDRADDRSPPLVAGVPKLGTVAELVAFARIAQIDMLIVTLPLSADQRILSLLKQLWVLPVDVRLSAYSADFAFPRRAGRGAEEGFIDVMRQPLAGVARLAKRAFDVVVASLALVALSPFMIATAIAIKADTPGPVFFRQLRHGFNDRPVRVWKFRSLRHEQADPDARRIVTRGDDRVTRVGGFIRKTSIDELPQLFNVIAGDLSLVGPRPHALNAMSSRQQTFTEIVEGYSGRHKVPPGITGWAQVNGWRGEIDDPESLRQRFEHDLYYIENWSFLLDLRILLLTPLRLFSQKNAY